MKNLICMILILLAAASNSMVVNENEKTELPTAIESEASSQIIMEEVEEKLEPEVQEIEIAVQEKSVIPKTEKVGTAKPVPAPKTFPQVAETQGQMVYVEGFGYVEVQAPTVTTVVTSDGDINKMVGIMD